MSRRRPEEIAIVGMGCRFPGAPDLSTFWENILTGQDCTREAPASPCDPATFRVLNRATLETVVAALADAGLTANELARDRTEVVIGQGNWFGHGNATRLQHGSGVARTMGGLSALRPEWSEADRDTEVAKLNGPLTNAPAARIGRHLNLSTDAYIVEAARASFLVALKRGMHSLSQRRTDLVIVGGIGLEAGVDFPTVLQQVAALSGMEVVRPFSAEAERLRYGDRAGVIILKRRVDADRDEDRVYAIVRGVGLAIDGGGRGLRRPGSRGHERAVRRAYRQTGIHPDSVMIGHAMPTVGAAGIIKTALSLYHRALPTSVGAASADPVLGDAGGGSRSTGKTKPWIHSNTASPRRVGLTSLEFAGINAHAILEEHAASSMSGAPGGFSRWDSEAILIAAEDRAGLVERVRWLMDRIRQNAHRSFKDMAYTLNCHHPHTEGGARVGLVAANIRELVERLGIVERKLLDPKCASMRDGRGIYFWERPLVEPGNAGLAFMFPGEGSQYPGMLSDLCLHFPEVLERFDIADRIALELGETVPPSESLFGENAGGQDALWSTATAVNIVLSSQWALYQLVSRLGLTPDAVVGHSSGELLALAAAGMFDTDRSLELQLGRLGSIFRGFESSGEMPAARLVAVAAARERVDAIRRDLGIEDASVAIDNCPHQVVLAGPPEPVSRVTARLDELNVLWEELPFDRAYHTESFSTVMGPIEHFFRNLKLKPPRMPIYSCASKRRMPGEIEGIRELAIEQWTRTVAFRETVETMHADGLRVFVDIGARGNLAGFVDDTLRGKPAFAIAANLPRRNGLTQLNHLVAATFAQGLGVRAGHLYAHRRPELIEWDAASRVAASTVEIENGFPETRSSEPLVAGLRSTGTVAMPVIRLSDRIDRLGEPREDSTDGEHSNSREWLGSMTGGGRPRIAKPAATTARREFGGEIGDREGGLPQGSEREWVGSVEAVTMASAVALRGLSEPEWVTHDVGQSSMVAADVGLFAFQKTMRAFLKTQQEVMAAYLESGATRVDEEIDEVTGVGGSQHDRGRRDSWGGPGRFAKEGRCRSGKEPGPWAGEIRSLIPGEEVETAFVLDQRFDPMAEHHTLGGRKVSAIDPTLKGLPVVPFAMMAEMVAEVAALVVTPGLSFTALSDIKAHKWVRYEEEPVTLELRGRRMESMDEESAWVGIYNRGIGGQSEATKPVFEAVVSFEEQPPAPPWAAEWRLDGSRPSRFTAESIYAEQWLFHGPPLQAVSEMGRISAGGIDGVLRVLPWEPLVESASSVAFHTDPIILDSFTHLLGCWGLDWMADQGDVMFPLSMERFDVFGERPDVGSEVACRIAIPELDRHRVRVNAEIVRADGSVWLRLTNWQDWRFHWPGRYRDVFRQPRDHFVGEAISPRDPDHLEMQIGASLVWMQPPGDMGRPVWRDVLENTQLGPEERREHLAAGGPERQRSQRLWGVVAAKEAARRLWQEEGAAPVYPADLAIVNDGAGRPSLTFVGARSDRLIPAIAVAHAEGVAVAMAAVGPDVRVGIDVRWIKERLEGFDPAAFTSNELTLLDVCKGDDATRVEWLTRFLCAKEAATKAIGWASSEARSIPTVVRVDFETGVVHAQRDVRERSGAEPEIVRVMTGRRGEYAWAWTLGEGDSE